jgi:integrase
MSTDVPGTDDGIAVAAVRSAPARRAVERLRFDERLLAALERPTAGSRYVYDTVEAGLCVRLTPTGAVYVFYRWYHGKPERLTIENVGDISLRQARRIVASLRGKLADGIDVFACARQAKQPVKPVTLQDAFDAHVARPDLRPGTRRDYASAWRNVPPHLRSKAITTIDTADLKRLHDALGGLGHCRLANKVVVIVSCLLRANGRQGDNPAVGIRRFSEAPRQRVLTLAELHRLRAALEQEPEPWRSYFLLLMLTGARRGTLAAMRWADLDLDSGVWRISATTSKNRKATTVALPGEAVCILRHLEGERGGSPWVFPANSGSGHLTEPKRAWRRVCQHAGIQGAVIHDLRRTLGTMVASDGANAATISAVLGHVSAASAKSYIHLSAEVGREFLERAARKTSRAA